MKYLNRIQWVLLACLSSTVFPAGAQDNDQAIKLYARGEYQAVVDLLDTNTQGDPPVEPSIQTRMLLARSYHHLDRLSDAVAVLGDVLKNDEDNAEANLLAGRSLYQLKRYEEAVAYLNTALRLKSEAHISGLLGLAWYEQGDLSKAKEYLQKALAEDVSDPAISRVLGQIYVSRGQGNRAEKHLLLARDAGDDSVALHRLLARAYEIQHKTIGPVLVRRLTDKPRAGQVVDGLLVLRPIEGQADQYQVCTKFCAFYEGYWLLEKNDNDGEALYLVASGWMTAGVYDQAAAFINRLANAEGESQRVLKLRADLALALADWPSLRKVLAGGDKAKLKPGQVVEYQYRAAMRIRGVGDHGPAVKFLEQADAINPTSAKVLRALINLSLTSGDRDAAIGYYRRLIDLFPDSRDIDELRNAVKQLEEQTGS